MQLVLTTFSPSLGCPKFFTHWTWGNGSNILVLLWCTLALLLSTQIRYPNVFLATALHHLNTHYLIIQLLPRSQSLLCHTSSTPSQHSLPHPTTPPTLPVLLCHTSRFCLTVLTRHLNSDPVPTWLLSLSIQSLTLSVTSDQFHTILKKSVVSLFLKKSVLNEN